MDKPSYVFYAMPGQLVVFLLFSDRMARFLHHVSNIVKTGPDRQMIYINAGPIIATVQYLHSLWDRPAMQLIHDAVGSFTFFINSHRKIRIRLAMLCCVNNATIFEHRRMSFNPLSDRYSDRIFIGACLATKSPRHGMMGIF